MKKLLVLGALLLGAGLATSKADSFGFSIGGGGFGGYFESGRGYYAPVAPGCAPRYYAYPRYNDHTRFHHELRHDHADLHRELRHQRAHGAPGWVREREHRYGHQLLREDHRDYHRGGRW